MTQGADRILTTHAGSLPRPDALARTIVAKARGETLDERDYAARVRRAVVEVVDKQRNAGVDIISDGEMGKSSFLTYVTERLSGFENDKSPPKGSSFARSREYRAFPEAYAELARGTRPPQFARMVCTGPITYTGRQQLQTDLTNLKTALQDRSPATAFVPSVSPTSIADFNPNRYYENEEAYLQALADAMSEEYKAIVDAGFLLQVDDPHLASYYVLHPELTVDQVRRWASGSVEVLNHALRGIPEEQIRWHTCYGINIGPRLHDMELKDLIDLIPGIRAGAYSFEAANPRHEHEWRLWNGVKLPPGKILIPGVITHSSMLVEHPEVVADRIVQYASVVGRDNVIAGSDCGFASRADANEIHATVVWAKIASLVAGAKIATERLWKRN